MKSKTNIVVVGNGKLADAIVCGLSGSVQRFGDQVSADSILVHVGSGRQYREALDLALERGYAFIQAATAKGFSMEPPEPGRIVYIDASNLDLHLIKLFHWLKLGSRLFSPEEICIRESHQASKTSAPGTAHKICDILGVEHAAVESIRDRAVQSAMGFTNLEQHAYHEILIGSEGSQIRIETRIEGADSYVAGLRQILKAVPAMPAGNYDVEELVGLI